MLKSMIFLSVLAGAATVAGTALSEADRHPGIYQFTPLPPGWCTARPPRSDLPVAAAVRPQRLGDLPPAYVIRLGGAAGPQPATADGARVLRFATPDANPPGYDACAGVAPTLTRVR